MNPPPVDQATLDTAVALVRAAGERTLRWFRSSDLTVERKGDGTPVTAADKDAERFLREQLAEAFPGDGVLGEEEAPTAGDHRPALDHRPDRRHQGLHVRGARCTRTCSPSRTSTASPSASSTSLPSARPCGPGAASAAGPSGARPG